MPPARFASSLQTTIVAVLDLASLPSAQKVLVTMPLTVGSFQVGLSWFFLRGTGLSSRCAWAGNAVMTLKASTATSPSQVPNRAEFDMKVSPVLPSADPARQPRPPHALTGGTARPRPDQRRAYRLVSPPV